MSRPLAWFLALAATAVVVLLVFTSRASQDRATPEPDIVLAREATGAVPTVELTEVAAMVATPEVVSDSRAPAVPQASALAPGSIEVRVVTEEHGRPIDGADVLIAPHGPWDHLPRVPTGPDGTLLQSDLRFGRWTVRATAADRSERVEFVTLDAENPSAHVQLWLPNLRVDREVRVRIVDALGQPATTQSLGIHGTVSMSLDVGFGPDCIEKGGAFKPTDRSYIRGSRDSSASGMQWTLVMRSDARTCVHLLLSNRVVATRELAPFETDITFRVADLDLERSTATCDVRIVDDARGEPVAGAQAMVTAASGASWHLQADADGRLPLDRLLVGEIKVRVYATDFAPEQFAIQIPAPGPVVLRLGLPRRAEGIVLDLTGEPVEGARVTIHGEDERGEPVAGFSYTVPSGRDGRFTFTSLPRKKFILALQKGKAQAAGPVVGGYRITGDLPHGVTAGQQFITGSNVDASELLGVQHLDLRDGDASGIVLRIDRAQL